jgi:hypothetical protein
MLIFFFPLFFYTNKIRGASVCPESQTSLFFFFPFFRIKLLSLRSKPFFFGNPLAVCLRKQASKEATKQASNQARKQASKQASAQASLIFFFFFRGAMRAALFIFF